MFANSAVSRYPGSSSLPNETVFFVITNVEHDALSNDATISQDIFMAATVGKLGCWVDTDTARMVQTGVEHSYVPDVAAYLGFGEGI
jgi:peroxin-6